MLELFVLADTIEKEFKISLEIISGGNSANYDWYKSAQHVGKINNLRLGESILLGCETLNRKAIPGLHKHAFQLIAEVIESKKSHPFHLERSVKMPLEILTDSEIAEFVREQLLLWEGKTF